MDWRIVSLGLLVDTVPCWWLAAIFQADLTWWNNGTFFVIPVIILCAVIVTTIGLAKHGPGESFAEPILVVLSAVIGGLVIVFGIFPVNLYAISYSWHCLESGSPSPWCDKASAINSVAWIWLTLLLAPAIAFFGVILLAARKRIGRRVVPEISHPGQAVKG